MELIEPSLKGTRKPVRFPLKITAELAEFLGIHFGDGNLYRKGGTFTLTYSFNQKEEALAKRTKDLFELLFGIKLKESKPRKGAISLYAISKPITQFLHQNFGLPIGPKRELSIPKMVFQKEAFLKAFIKGLHWTDGCSFIKRDRGYFYPIVKITTICPTFAKEIQNGLRKMEFRATISEKKGLGYHGFDVVLHGKNQYAKWIREISQEKMIKSGDAGIRMSE